MEDKGAAGNGVGHHTPHANGVPHDDNCRKVWHSSDGTVEDMYRVPGRIKRAVER
jgi:hypothetical protein